MAAKPLTGGRHFAIGLFLSQGAEHRIIPEALITARRPDGYTFHPTKEGFRMPIGPGQRQSTSEPCAAIPAGAEFRLHTLHRGGKIPVRPCPTGGVNPGRAP